jgi:hypothetical protein
LFFPDQWKIAHVIALLKKGDTSLPSNYRPVSLLSCVSKILEKIVNKQIYTFNVEIISITSCSQTSISERTFKHLQSKSGKTLFSSFKLDMEETVLTESKYKQQRNKVNNLKKQANKKFYANINENLDELKSANDISKVLRKRSRICISLLKVESNQTLSSFLIITSLVGMHILAIFKNIDVKSETAP